MSRCVDADAAHTGPAQIYSKLFFELDIPHNAIWSVALSCSIKHIGDDLDQWILSLRAFAPKWMAYDFKYMVKRFQGDGVVSTAAGLERLHQRLGRNPRSYSDFVLECAKLRSVDSN